MGIASQIESAGPNPPQPKSATDGPNHPGRPPAEARPCPTCSCPIWWRSRYGGELRCGECDPWPARALVSEKLGVVVRPGGGFEFEPFGWPGPLAKSEAEGRADTRMGDSAQGRKIRHYSQNMTRGEFDDWLVEDAKRNVAMDEIRAIRKSKGMKP